MADPFDSLTDHSPNELALAKGKLRLELRARRRALNSTQQAQASLC